MPHSSLRTAALLGLAALMTSLGCAGRDDSLDLKGLWRDGYGFNNPNAKRLENYEKPAKESWLDWLFG